MIAARTLSTTQNGMTLLELLLVVTILSAVAFMSLATVTDNTSQVRYDDTRNRIEAVKLAVIGDPNRTINGEPEVRGFVADMGRLPNNLQELINREYCSNPQYPDSGSCTAATETWTSLPAYAYDAATGIWSGWNGPYLAASPDSDYAKYRDGWGNDDGSNDFGWNFALNADALELQSLGLDNATGGSDYEADYPPAGYETVVYQNDYRTLITDSKTPTQNNDGTGGLSIDFGAPVPCWRCSDGISVNRSTCESSGNSWSTDTTITDNATCIAAPGQWQPSESICMRITYRSNGALSTYVSSGLTGNHTLTWNGTVQTARFTFEDTTTPFDEDTYLPMGQMAYRVFEYDTGTNTCTPNEYPKGSDWRLFTLVPKTAIQPLKWAVN